MRAGWVLVVAGIVFPVVFQHAEAVVFGALMALFGLWVLTVKEVAR